MPDSNDILYTQYGLSFDFVKTIYEFFGGSGSSVDTFFATIQHFWLLYSIFAFIVSALFIFGIIYSFIRFNQLSEIQTQQLLDAEKLWAQMHAEDSSNRQWQDVQQHIASENPNDWKLAIIEADVMLDRMLDTAGYAGATIADKLRSASHRSFKTVDDAWQAHRVRNQIAHGGSDFVLTQKVARDTIIQFQHVFEEFGII